ncbi:DNA-binding protein [Candidatus Desantisbacteria bacterium CG07_land_8_20_14_0_80_39_15]|uniref:DNA-binding protein n=1 Tax=Candidatus Desantisbacteria bacterium CG07_land_8_20_14_0_80_39_15 TaxID=1974549 RepID=A0A2M6ZFE9_9BACT|nr:MAG: DNA-binding protein [Candidatus Desantisbacteria bacterium CG07_land_8_20_14_0_80_39_15]
MEKQLIFRLPDELYQKVIAVSDEIQRPKSFIIRKALEIYINDYVDYQIALDRLNDKDDKIISSKEMRRRIAKD